MKKSTFLTLDFWVISFLVLCCIIFMVVSEAFPFDIYLSSKRFRNNPQFVYQKNLSRMMICKKSFYTDDLNKYFQDPELLFEQTTFHFKSKFKDKRMAVVKLGGSHFVAQEFSSSGLSNLLYFLPFRATRAFRAWFYGNKLANEKVFCAKPLLFIEKRLGPFRLKSYLLVNYISGLSGGEYFENLSAFKEHWPSVIESIHQQLLQLETLPIKHIDFGLDSFMVKNEEPYLIDLENIRGYKFRSFLPKRKASQKYFSSLKEEIFDSNSSAYELFDQKSLRAS